MFLAQAYASGEGEEESEELDEPGELAKRTLRRS
jgi:hypothetical protein